MDHFMNEIIDAILKITSKNIFHLSQNVSHIISVQANYLVQKKQKGTGVIPSYIM